MRLPPRTPLPPASARDRGRELPLAHIIEAYERDREALSLELHDSVLQTLASALYRLQAAERSAAGSAGVQEDLSETVALLRESMDAARKLSQELRPVALDSAGIVETLRYSLERLGEETGCDARLETQIEPLPREVELALYRILHEAILNVRKHSLTRSLRIRLWVPPSRRVVYAEVRDAGRGFDPARVPPDRVGLLSMRARARAAGGECRVLSSPGHGTTILVRLPLETIPGRAALGTRRRPPRG